MASAHLHQPVLPSNPKSEDWRLFKRQFQNYLLIVDAGEAKKFPYLMSCIGGDGFTIYDGLPEPKLSYDDAVRRFDDFFKTRSSVLLLRKRFYEAKQEPRESITEFACRLRRLICECDFPPAFSDTLLRDIFVCGVHSNVLGERLLSEDSSTLTFTMAITRGEAWERARSERQSVEVNQIASSCLSKQPASARVCHRCNSQQHMASSPTCPARSAKCRHCGKIGHFQVICKSRLATARAAPKQTPGESTSSYGQCVSTLKPTSQVGRQKIVRCVESAHDSCTRDSLTPACETSDAEYNVQQFYDIYATSRSLESVTRCVEVNGYPLSAICDTGAELNILPEHSVPELKLDHADVSIFAWGHFKLPVLGCAMCSISYNGVTVNDMFYVIRSDTRCRPLLTYALCHKLGIIAELASVQGLQSGLNTILMQHSDVFTQEGFLNTGYVCDVSLTEDAKPVSVPARRVPPKVLPLLKEEVAKMCRQGIIREISEPTDWCSALVIAYKKDGSIRCCADLRNLNKYVKRSRMQIPTFEEIRASFSGATVFSVLDCTGGFYQIPIAEACQTILTFATPFGRYCYQRMPMGLTSAPEIYQKIMTDLLADIDGAVSYIDDILIAAPTLEEHNSILNKVLKRLKVNGMRLNREKCHFAKSQVNFLGHIWTAEGVTPDARKLSAIKNIALPATGEELRSFLGLATYLGSHSVPHFSTVVAPLWTMPKSGSLSNIWTEDLVSVFKHLKSELLAIQSRIYFDHSKSIKVFTDASGVGIAGVLVQENRPVLFVSRALTAVETRYSTIEKEMLAIVFALMKLKTYLLGSSFDVITDHKPILGIVNKPIDRLSNRLQRWILNIQHFRFSVSYLRGRDNVLADALSRLPTTCQPDSVTPEEEPEYTLCFILKAAPIDMRRVAAETAKDSNLQAVIDQIMGNWCTPDARNVQPYYTFRAELSMKLCRVAEPDSKVVLRGDRIIIPSTLRKEVMQQVHEGHMGAQKMKDVIRAYAYWPGYSRDIEEFVKHCDACTTFQVRGDRPAISPIAETTTFPYQQISLDLTSPSEALQGRTLLTIIDYYSHYPEAYVLSKGDVHEILSCLREMFVRYGLPVMVTTDNGSVFRSEAFNAFLRSIGTQHNYSSNYHPCSNGTIERLHATLKSRIKRIVHDKRGPLRAALDATLYDICSTPNAVTGVAPFSRFFGRPMRTKLALLSDRMTEAKGSARDVIQEYSKVKGIDKRYAPGAPVFFRKGKGQPFVHEGQIVEVLPNHAYIVKTTAGYERQYNQVNIKPRSKESDNTLQDAEIAYDMIAEAQGVTPEAYKETTGQVIEVQRNPRYDLRKRTVDPKVYRV